MHVRELGRASESTVGSIPGAQAAGPIIWPVPGFTYFSQSSFGGDRPSNCSGEECERFHCGIDVHAPYGQICVAMGPGKVTATQGWASKKGRPDRTSQALLLQLDGGPVIVYGGMQPDSWRELGIDVGSRVELGQPVSRVGFYPNGSTMAHLESRQTGARVATPWEVTDPGPPANLTNLTPLLTRARQGTPGEWRSRYDWKNPRPPVTPIGVPTPAEPLPVPTTPAPLTGARAVQEALRLLVDPGLVVDGKIGPATRAATRLFQQTHGLDVDGVIGPKTIAALEVALQQIPILERLLSTLKDAISEVTGL